MRLIIATLCLTSMVILAPHSGAELDQGNRSKEVRLLAGFEESTAASGWMTVNDNVMGGRSIGGPHFGEGFLTFKGATNTNGGGFSSIRTTPGQYDLRGFSGLLIRVKGDGRSYKAGLRSDATKGRWGRTPFRADFKTEAGKWQEIFLPFEAFTPSFRGRKLQEPPALDLSKISSFGFMIYDKKDGEFALHVDWVKAIVRR